MDLTIDQISNLADRIEACGDDGQATELLIGCDDGELTNHVLVNVGRELAEERPNSQPLRNLFVRTLRGLTAEPPDAPDAEQNRARQMREWYRARPSFSEWLEQQGGARIEHRIH